MKRFKAFPLAGCGVVLCALLLSACGGKTPQNGPGPLEIQNTSPLPTGAEGDIYSQSLMAFGGTAPYTWDIDSGALPPGLSLSASSGIISGTPPQGSAGTYSVTVRVTDSESPVKAYQVATLALTINPPLSFASASLPNAVIQVAYSSAVTAMGGINCEPAQTTPCYTFALVSGSTLPAGLMLDTNGNATGTPGAIYGTPTGPIGTYSFSVQVTDQYPTTATADFTITVVGKIQGNYAFSFNGYNNGQAFYMAGSFCADGNGVINPANEPLLCPTSSLGVLDRNGNDSIGVLTNVAFTGTYTIDDTTNLAKMTLTIPGLGIYHYNLAVSVVADTRFIQIDSGIYGSGVIRATTSLTIPSGSSSCGGYAFGFFGNDAAGQRLAGAGSFVPSSSGGLTGVEDTNDNGVASGQTSFTGTITPPVQGGSPRGTMTFTVGSNTSHYAFYVVVPSTPIPQLLAVQTDPITSGAALTLAAMIRQFSPGATCTFGNQALSGVAVTELNAVAMSSNAPDISLGLATFDGKGNISSYTFDQNNGGNLTTPAQNSYKGTYAVDATTGRVSVDLSGVTNQPVWYLVKANSGSNAVFVVGTDPNVTAGSFEPQIGSDFLDIALFGKLYGGTITPVLSSVTNEADSVVVTAAGSGTCPATSGTIPTLCVTFDTNGPGGPGMANQALTATYSVDSTGRTIVCDSSGVNMSGTGCNGKLLDVLYVVSAGTAGATGAGAKDASVDTSAHPRLTIFVH